MADPDAPTEEVEEGAPMWVVTFGDLMSLLMCFFVLLLSFSEMDRNKYRIVSGSMKNAFGMQREKPVFESPKGQKMISREFDQAIVLMEIDDVVDPIIRELEEEFKELQESVDIVVDDEEITIRMMGEATFDTGKAVLKKEFTPLLMKIGQILRTSQGQILIAGHTDDVPLNGGPYNTNLGLSIARAGSVANFLLKSSSLDPRRISAMGFGEHRPLESNDTEDGRNKNRRVEIIVTKVNK